MGRFLPIFVAIEVQLGFRALGYVKTFNFLNPTKPQQESFYSFPKTVTSFPDRLLGALVADPRGSCLPALPDLTSSWLQVGRSPHGFSWPVCPLRAFKGPLALLRWAPQGLVQ